MSRPRVQVHYDTHPETPNDIDMYMHCARCLEEMPAGVSPKEWARTQTGIRSDGHIQVVCTRHDINIAVLTLKVK